MGSMIQSVAAAWLMTELTGSHLLIALVAASTTIPVMLLGVFAGAIADNFDRRRVMLAAQTGMLIVSAALTVTTYLDAITPLTLLFFTLAVGRSEEHTSELQSLMRISYAVFCLKKKKHKHEKRTNTDRYTKITKYITTLYLSTRTA